LDGQLDDAPERPTATFIEDAYRRAVSGALGELAADGEQEAGQ
jgi:hypothetical protein